MNLDRLQQSGMTLEQVMQLMREGLNGSNGPIGPRGPGSSAVLNNLLNLGAGGGLAAAAIPAIAGLAGLGVTGKGIYDVVTKKEPSIFSDVGLGLNPVTALFYWPARQMGFFSSGKSREQRNRDDYRKTLKDAGLIDDNYQMNLPSGASLDWGKDGQAKLPNVGKIEGNPNSGTERFYYQTDLSNPNVMNNIGALNALGYIGGRGNKRLADNITGLASNTVGQGDVKQNSRELINKFGGRDVVYGGVLDAFSKGYISEEQRDAALAGIDALWGIPNGAKPEEIKKIIEGRR